MITHSKSSTIPASHELTNSDHAIRYFYIATFAFDQAHWETAMWLSLLLHESGEAADLPSWYF